MTVEAGLCLAQVSSWSMEFVWKRRWYLQLGCILTLNVVYANLDYPKETPPSLGQIDHQCWEVSSHGLVEMKKLKVADTVIALWDFMMFLKESPKPKHNELFNDLAQNFWDMLPREVMESPSLELFKKRVDMLPREVVDAPSLEVFKARLDEALGNLV
ncbi:protein FAM237B [Grus japonensis]|uniref:Protein FAM237B n=1 Tax=Grus japonensis TaxID=30415 RepID=A0ABC9WK21_GRUJA